MVLYTLAAWLAGWRSRQCERRPVGVTSRVARRELPWGQGRAEGVVRAGLRDCREHINGGEKEWKASMQRADGGFGDLKGDITKDRPRYDGFALISRPHLTVAAPSAGPFKPQLHRHGARYRSVREIYRGRAD